MIAIIDYGLGNLGSVKNALDKLNVNSMVSNSISDMQKAAGIILPGVGSANAGMKNLKERKLDAIIIAAIKNDTPLLGICLGMQLLFSYSDEGEANCLNIIDGNVKKFTGSVKIPQIGWNRVFFRNSRLSNGVKNNSFFYFVNSFYCDPENKTIQKGVTDYSQPFCSVIESENIFGVQFHPEKSGDNGLQLLQNFVDIVYENTTSN